MGNKIWLRLIRVTFISISFVLFLNTLNAQAQTGAITVSPGPANPTPIFIQNDATDLEMLQMSITETSGLENVVISSISFNASGSANDRTDITGVALVLDVNNNGEVNAGDIIIQTNGIFSADDGVVTFSQLSETINSSSTENWLVVYDLASTALDDSTFLISFASNGDITATGSTSGMSITPTGAPVSGRTATVAQPGGLSITPGPNNPGDSFELVDASDLSLLQITISETTNFEAVLIQNITFSGSGSGDDQTDVSSVRLFRDNNSNGQLDDGSDTPIGSLMSFSVDNGTILLSNINRLINSGTSENWILVYDLAGTASDEETFVASLQSPSDVIAFGSESSASIVPDVSPTPASGGTKTIAEPGALSLSIGVNTPGNRTGPGVDPALEIIQVNLAETTGNEDLSVGTMTFLASGTGNDVSMIDSVSLYRDVDGDGTFSAPVDIQIGTNQTYNSNDGTASFTGISETIPASSSVNLLLVYELNVPADSGGTFIASIVSNDDIVAAGTETNSSVVVTGAPINSYQYRVNFPPILNPIGPKTVNENVNLSFDVTGNDPDSTVNTLTLSTLNLPSGASFTDNGDGTGSFNWTPTFFQAGMFNVTFQLVDADSGIDSEVVAITVLNVNGPPVFDPVSNKTVMEGQLLQFSVTANDPDDDPITFSVNMLPEGASFDSISTTSRFFTWTPGFDQAGQFTTTFIASDGTFSDSLTVGITVNDKNGPPILDPVGDRMVNEGDTLTIVLSASDPDDDPLTYGAEPLPAGASFTDSTFGWRPDFTQAGESIVTFSVDDGQGNSDSENVTITVSNVNLPPVIEEIPDTTIDENQLLEIKVIASDPDADPILLTSTNLPDGATFVDNNNGTGTFSWLPTFLQASIYAVNFIAADTAGAADTTSVQIVVNNVNGPPILGTVGDKTVNEGQLLSFSLSASDPDNDSLRFFIASLPTGSEFTDNGNGTAVFSWTPTFGQAGVFGITFRVEQVGNPSMFDEETVTVTVVDVNITITPTEPINFGNVGIGNSDTEIITVRNDGEAEITIELIEVSGSQFGLGNLPEFPATLSADSQFVFIVSFSPVATGNFNGTVTIDSPGTDEPSVVVDLEGVGVAPGITVTPSSVDFGDILVGSSSDAIMVTIRNDGTADLTVNSVSDPGAPFSLSNLPTLPATIPANDSITFTVMFSPTTTGTFNETVTVSSNDTNNPTVVINLLGTGIAPSMTVIPTSIDFGNVMVGNSSEPATVTIRNDGTADLTVNSIFEPGAPFSLSTLPTLPVTIAASESIAFTAMFAPATTGVFGDTVTVTGNDANNPTVDVALTGTGSEPANNPPVIDDIPDTTILENQLLQFTVTATDADDDQIIFSGSGLPDGSTFNAQTQVFSWQPDDTQAGVYIVTFTASDGKGGSDTEDVTITVSEDLTIPLRVVSSFPSDGDVDVALQLTLTITFNRPVSGIVGAVNVVLIPEPPSFQFIGFADGEKSVLFSTTLNANTTYSMAVSTEGVDPTFVVFSTGSSIPQGSVSGVLTFAVSLDGVLQLNAAESLVLLLSENPVNINFDDDEQLMEVIRGVGRFDSTGVYTINNVPAGSFYLVAMARFDSVNTSGTLELAGFYDPGDDGQPDNITLIEGGSLTNVDFGVGFPKINSILPGSGASNTQVTIRGINFSEIVSENGVTFDGVAASINSAEFDTLVVTVPLGASSGPVIVTVRGLASNAVQFNVTDELTVAGTRLAGDFFTTGKFTVTIVPLDDNGNLVIPPTLQVTSVECGTSFTETIDSVFVQTLGMTGNPLAIALNFDASGSMANNDPDRLRVTAGIEFVNLLGSTDQAAVLDFGSSTTTGFNHTELLQGFTSIKGDLINAINVVKQDGSGTPLFESLIEVINFTDLERSANSFNRALFLLSDGEPSSTDDRQAAISRSLQTGIPIFTVGLGPAAEGSPNASEVAVNTLRNLAESTSGIYASTSDPSGLSRIFQSIAQTLTQGQVGVAITMSPIPQPGASVGCTIATNFGQGRFTFVVPSSPPPAISSITPDRAQVGQAVTIAGSNFSAVANQNVVFFNGVPASNIISTSATAIGVEVPQNATSGPVIVTTNGQDSNSFDFTVVTDVTPPSFTIGILQNSILTSNVNIFVIPSEPLSQDPTISLDATPIPIVLTIPLGGEINIYVAQFTLPGSGTFQVTVAGEDLEGNEGASSESFSASLVLAKSGGIVSSTDRKLNLLLDGGTIDTDRYILSVPAVIMNGSESDIKSVVERNDSNLSVLSKSILPFDDRFGSTIYVLEPSDLLLHKKSKLIMSYGGGELGEVVPETLRIFRWQNGRWTHVESYVDTRSETVTAFVDRLGIYRLQSVDLESSPDVPTAYSLSQNHPNPFNPSTSINYTLRESGLVSLNVYNARGRLVKTLVSEEKVAGGYVVHWNGTDNDGNSVSSGIYIYQLNINGYAETRKMLLLK